MSAPRLTCGGKAVWPYDPGGTHIWDPGGGEPRWLVSSRLPEISAAPRGLLAQTKESVQLEGFLRYQTLPFTSEEIAFLESRDHDPEIVIDNVIESSGKAQKVVFMVDGVRNVSKPQRTPCNLPLGEITTRRIDYQALYELPIPPSAELTDAFSWILTNRMKKYLMAHPDFAETRSTKCHHVSRYLASDLGPLHDQELFSLAPWGPGALEVPLFKVPKSNYVEARLIGDCRSINKLLPKSGHMGLPELPTLIRHLLARRILFQLDARSFFYAFGVSDDASEVFSVRWGDRRGKFYTSRWRVMPQGFSMAPRIAQLTSKLLCANASAGLDVTLEPWVDNFLHGTDDMETMTTLVERFGKVCDLCNVDLKPSDAPPGPLLDAIGLHFDVSSDDIMDHFVEIQESFRVQMLEDQRLLSTTMTPRQYFQIFGGCMWGNYAVGRQPLCRWPHALQTLRDIAIGVHKDGTQEAWDKPTNISTEALQDLKNLSDELMNTKKTLRSLSIQPPTRDFWTDASSWALGYLQTNPTLGGTPYARHPRYFCGRTPRGM